MTPIDLYVDDVRNPLDGYTLARTVEDAQGYLLTGLVRYLSLDHDMGCCADCHDDAEKVGNMRCEHVPTGYDLLVWMKAHKRWSLVKPEVHSANPVGAARMRAFIAEHFPRA